MLDEELDDEVRLPEGDGTITQALQVLLAHQMAEVRRAQRRKEGIAGHRNDADRDDSGDEWGSLPGAKGALAGERLRRAMAKSLKANYVRMEQNAVMALEAGGW